MADKHARTLEEALADVTARVHRYAEHGPYRLFPDDVVISNLLAKMARNLVEHGAAYCPCRPVTGDPARDRLNLCPCRVHHKEIARDGHCECRLYVSEDYLRQREAARAEQEG